MILAADEVVISGGLSTTAHVVLALATLAMVLFILRLLRRRQLASKYAVLWIVVAVGLGILALFPGVLTTVSEWIGIYYPPALLLLVMCGFLFIVVIQFSWELSRLEDRSRILAEEIALLRAERDRDRGGPDDGDGGEPAASSIAPDSPA